MKQQLVTAIDFYLETQKINPFHLHIGGNASSSQLVQLRNNAYILNKLSLLHLEPSSQQFNTQSYLQQYCQLYNSSLQAIINNPMMPYKDFQSVKDLVYKIQHYHKMLTKLTISDEGLSEESYKVKKKLSLNLFWPRIRALMIGMEQKVPNNYAHIRQFITLRRGLMETDKQYFVAQMMAKKIQSSQLQFLIKSYSKKTQQNQQSALCSQAISQPNNIQSQTQVQNNEINWREIKTCVRMICFTNQLSDWKKIYYYLNSPNFNEQLPLIQRTGQLNFIKDVLKSIKQKQPQNIQNQNIIHQNLQHQSKINESKNNSQWNWVKETLNLIYKTN